MTNHGNTATSWWGSFNLGHNQSRLWRIGPLTLIVRCLNGEWQVGHERIDDFDENDAGWEMKDTDQLPESLSNCSRYVFRDTSSLLTITPLAGDRPVISRPRTPFNLTAGEEATLYVSSPLWLELSVGSSPKKVIEIIAIQRPSDTWFGPSTREGELCYASTTHCRLHIDEMPQRPHRALTPVFIRNQADTTLLLERLNVPVPLLPLYAAADMQLWTPKITLIRGKTGDMAELKIESQAPEEAAKATQLSNPRKTANNGLLISAFNAVFS